jgi:hypothetical protein
VSPGQLGVSKDNVTARMICAHAATASCGSVAGRVCCGLSAKQIWRKPNIASAWPRDRWARSGARSTLLESGKRKQVLEGAIVRSLRRFADRTYAFDAAAAESAAVLLARARSTGLPLGQLPTKLANLQLAGIASAPPPRRPPSGPAPPRRSHANRDESRAWSLASPGRAANAAKLPPSGSCTVVESQLMLCTIELL